MTNKRMDVEPSTSPIAVLFSGGLDSAILVCELLKRRPVQPIYIRSRLRWEAVERLWAHRFLEALRGDSSVTSGDAASSSSAVVDATRLAPLLELEETFNDIYGEHWSTTGRHVP